jgi:hypothetical protein
MGCIYVKDGKYPIFILGIYFFLNIYWDSALGLGGGGGVGTQRPLFRHCLVGSLAGARLSNDKYKPPVE